MKKLLILASVMFALGGCSESDGGSGADPNDGKVAVSFVLPGIGVETEAGGAVTAPDASSGRVTARGFASGGGACSDVPATRTGAAVALDEGVTVRILAYKAGSSLASAASDGYVDEATYVAAKVNDGSGDKIILTPCTVALDASGIVSSVSTTGASPLYLLPGTYDFYAITPAFASADHKSVSVAHGDDFASSSTAGVELKFGGTVEQPKPGATDGSKLTGSDGAVTLAVLDRKCSKIVFDVDRKSETAFDKLQIVSVKMTKMTKSPVALKTLTDDIYTSPVTADSYIYDNNATFAFPETAFQKVEGEGLDADYPYKWTVESPVLPKKSDKYGIELQVRFGSDAGNGDKEATTLATTDDQIGALAFLPDVRYTFGLKLKGNGIQLILSITPWNTPGDWGSSIGGYPSTYIVVGEWEVTWDWSTDVGGYPVLQGFTVDGWKPNTAWNSELGTYLSVVFGSVLKDWTGNHSWGNGLGDYQSFEFSPKEWVDPDNSWGTEFQSKPE